MTQKLAPVSFATIIGALALSGCFDDEVTCLPNEDDISLHTAFGGANETFFGIAYWCFPDQAMLDDYSFQIALPDGTEASFEPNIAELAGSETNSIRYWVPPGAAPTSSSNTDVGVRPTWLVTFDRWETVSEPMADDPRVGIMWLADADNDPDLLPEGYYNETVTIREDPSKAMVTSCNFRRSGDPFCNPYEVKDV